MVLELRRHRWIIYDVLDLLCPKSTSSVKYVSQEARANAHIVPIPGDIEQHEGERLLHARQSPEGDPPEQTVSSFFGYEAPLRAHGACGEHALQVVLDIPAVVRGAGGPDKKVEFVGMDGTGVHLCGPPAAVRSSGKQPSLLHTE
jgi:hypothetical protein